MAWSFFLLHRLIGPSGRQTWAERQEEHVGTGGQVCMWTVFRWGCRYLQVCRGVAGISVCVCMDVDLKDPTLSKRHISSLPWLTVL